MVASYGSYGECSQDSDSQKLYHPHYSTYLAVGDEEEFALNSREEAQAALQSSVIAPLPDVGMIQCEGVDAHRFLQGQLTCQVDEVNSYQSRSQSRLACYCDHKGRIVTTLRLLKAPWCNDDNSPDLNSGSSNLSNRSPNLNNGSSNLSNRSPNLNNTNSNLKSGERDFDNGSSDRQGHSFLLLLPISMIDLTLSELKKFAVFSKVKLTDLSAENRYLHMGVSGADAKAILEKHHILPPNTIPDTIPDTIHGGVTTSPSSGITSIAEPGSASRLRYQLFGDAAAILSLWERLSQECTPVNPMAWNLLDIMSGIPSISPQTSGLFTPHQINYPELGGVSFKKGCYRGQEIIARMEYLGKVKQKLYRAHLSSTSTDSAPFQKAPEMGSELVHQDGTLIGHIVNVAPDPKAGWQLLAVLNSAMVKDEESLNLKEGGILRLC